MVCVVIMLCVIGLSVLVMIGGIVDSIEWIVVLCCEVLFSVESIVVSMMKNGNSVSIVM